MNETSERKTRERMRGDFESYDEESQDEYEDNEYDDNTNYVEFHEIARHVHASLIGHVSDKALTLCEFLTINDVADILEKVERTD